MNEQAELSLIRQELQRIDGRTARMAAKLLTEYEYRLFELSRYGHDEEIRGIVDNGWEPRSVSRAGEAVSILARKPKRDQSERL